MTRQLFELEMRSAIIASRYWQLEMKGKQTIHSLQQHRSRVKTTLDREWGLRRGGMYSPLSRLQRSRCVTVFPDQRQRAIVCQETIPGSLTNQPIHLLERAVSRV